MNKNSQCRMTLREPAQSVPNLKKKVLKRYVKIFLVQKSAINTQSNHMHITLLNFLMPISIKKYFNKSL